MDPAKGHLRNLQIAALIRPEDTPPRLASGLRDAGALAAAVAHPQAIFGGEDLYPEPPAKAAALMHSRVMTHPFVDGNTRFGAHAALLFLRANGFDADISPNELTDATLATAQGNLPAEALTVWLRQRLRPMAE